MRLEHIVSLWLAALASCSLASSNYLPADHYLWGVKGPAGASLVRRAATPKPGVQATKASTQSYQPSKAADARCKNSPRTRGCWDGSLNIDSDVSTKWPDTGKVVPYTLTITNSTCNPDGHIERLCLLVNNQYPGPTIHASWGDTLRVTVVNQMQDNGTSLHFHGLRQLGSNAMDGTNGITECPLAPGESKTYTFQATQHGSSWYRSHYSAQYGDGVMGAIVIDGPATANYDIDLGSFIVNEWYYQTAFQINYIVNVRLQLLPTGDLPASGPPASDNILINGTNKDAQGSGKYGKTIMEQGKRYRLRIINTAVDNALRVSLDDHPFEVISADFVPIKPFVTDTLLLNIGQRYDVVISANQTIGNYWFRTTVDEACRAFNHGKGLSIFSYAGATSSDPTTTGPTFSSCNDEVVVPWWPMTVPSSSFSSQAQDLAVDVQQPGIGTNGASVVAWNINMTAQDVSWETPVLSYVYNNTTKYPVTENLLSIPNENTWVYWIIQETASSAVPIPHPIHLHGHDFYVLGTGQGQWNSSSPMNFETSPRRDSAILPGGGYLVIAFLADNPGAWLMHCHIAWHISEGLGVTFLEGASTIPSAAAGYDSQCSKWKNYYSHAAYNKTDSGL